MSVLLPLLSTLSTFLLQKTLRKQSDSVLGTLHVPDSEPGHVSLGGRKSTPERRLSDYAVRAQGQVRQSFLRIVTITYLDSILIRCFQGMRSRASSQLDREEP